MAHSLQECIEICNSEYPDFTPYKYAEAGTVYIFQLILKNEDPEHSISEYHAVDSSNGRISGGYSSMEMASKEWFRKLWNKAKKVNDEISHQSLFKKAPVGSDGKAWAIRRSTNDAELTHHGIKGQSWGVRNGPPYPLDADVHKRVVTGENQVKEKGLIPEIIGGALLLFEADAAINGPIAKTIRRIKQNKSTAESKELNDVLIGDIAEHVDFSKDNPPPIIKGKHSVEDDMFAINPNYRGQAVPGTTNNCALCSFTYDMRRRGYDVTAKPSIRGNYDSVLMTDLYKGGHVDKISKNDWTFVYSEAAKKYPDGARGVVGAYSQFGGHAMAWEIQNNQLVIIDAQRNVKSSPEELSTFGFQPNNVEFIRTDNLELRTENVGKVCSQLKPDWKDTVRDKNKSRSMYEADTTANNKRMTKAEKRAALARVWKQDHEGHTYDSDASRRAMENWIDSNMWSLFGHEGIVLIHKVGASNSLAHYGIKGQQWGIRRFQNEDGTLTPEGKERYTNPNDQEKKEHQTGTNLKGDPVKIEKSGSSKWKANEAEELSEAELDRRNRRLQKEKQYKDLTTPQWKKDVSNLAKEAGKLLLFTAAVTPLAVVASRKYKYVFAKARDWLHKIAGHPLATPTNPETYFNSDKKKK